MEYMGFEYEKVSFDKIELTEVFCCNPENLLMLNIDKRLMINIEMLLRKS
jgi:hypothetical protein